MAGNDFLQIQAYGNITFLVSTHHGRRELLLTDVAYVPDYFAKVIGLSRMGNNDIHFNPGWNCVYLRNQTLVKRKYQGHWFINAKPIKFQKTPTPATPISSSQVSLAASSPSTPFSHQ